MLELQTTTRPTHEALGIFGKIPFLSGAIIRVRSRLTGRTLLPDDIKVGEVRRLMQENSRISPDRKTEVQTTVHVVHYVEVPEL